MPSPGADAAQRRRPRLGEGDVGLSVFLALLLASTVLAWPLRDAGADVAVAVLRALTLVAGVVAIAPARVHATLAAVAGLAVGYGQLASDEHAPLPLAARIAFFALVAAALLARVFRPGRVTVHRLLGAVSVYVLLAVVWGTAYEVVVVLRPGALRGAAGPATLDEAMWMSFVTLTTTGYGDVLPVSPIARALAMLEAMTGVLFPALLLSRLVSLVQAPPAAGDR